MIHTAVSWLNKNFAFIDWKITLQKHNWPKFNHFLPSQIGVGISPKKSLASGQESLFLSFLPFRRRLLCSLITRYKPWITNVLSTPWLLMSELFASYYKLFFMFSLFIWVCSLPPPPKSSYSTVSSFRLHYATWWSDQISCMNFQYRTVRWMHWKNINLVGVRGVGWDVRQTSWETRFLSTPTLLKINKFYSLRIILLGSDHKQRSSCHPGSVYTHVNSHCLSCMPRNPAMRTEAMFWLIQFPDG